MIPWYDRKEPHRSTQHLHLREIKNLQQAPKRSPVMVREKTLGWEWESLIALFKVMVQNTMGA